MPFWGVCQRCLVSPPYSYRDRKVCFPGRDWGGGFLELLMALPKASSSVGQGGHARDGFRPTAGEPWGWWGQPVRQLQPEVMLQLVLICTCTTTNA